MPTRVFSLCLLASAALLEAQSPTLQARAEAARSDLAGRLSKRLQAVIATDGPEAAIQVCQGEAPGLAAEVGKAHGVRIGRTSFKLRREGNAVPAWAREAVAARQAEATFSPTPEGGLRALMPIRTGQPCLVCHGPAETLSPGVRKALAAAYPQDQATGFKAGDLRGWFWVDVPAEARP